MRALFWSGEKINGGGISHFALPTPELSKVATKKKELFEEEMATGWTWMRGEPVKGRLKACQREEEVRLGGNAFFFPSESSDVRLACCPRRTAEKSI